ncbi:hypothetical protein DFR70_11755 [Nocardia tenerifensis]|uniref:Uncharacterized protein n=1 Tax=Nocardia tenerifensis TaxID=228006 RepID=A0A318JRS5_9NOCA|nr:hypothetical protein [Nocardia tenerifensis]PXX57627.1 hypothetical protein DFR70_11755 [Nocardia tenerifensis]
MDDSAELYAELLSKVEALLPDVAAEVRREVARGGREIELYELPEVWEMYDGLSVSENGLPETTVGHDPNDTTVATPFEDVPQPHNDPTPRPDLVQSLSGDQALETLLEALSTLLRVVDGSEQEFTVFLSQWGIRSVAFGVDGVRQARVGTAETSEVSIHRERIREHLSELLAALREQQW